MKLIDNYENKNKILEENLFLKEKELIFNQERLQLYDKNANDGQIKIFENEINKIRYILKEKTLDFLKLEFSYKKNNEEYSINNSKMRQYLEQLKEENYKYIEAFNNIQLYMENKNYNKISEIFSEFNLEKNNNNRKTIETEIDIDCKNTSYGNISNRLNTENRNEKLSSYAIQDYLIPLHCELTLPNQSKNRGKEKTFHNKVLEEFDKVLTNELKRIQKHHVKIDLKTLDSPLKKKISISERRASREKNYIEWRGRSSNQFFKETHRPGNRESSKGLKDRSVDMSFKYNITLDDRINTQLNQSTIGDYEMLVHQAKERVRSSITLNRHLKTENTISINNTSFGDQVLRTPNDSPPNKRNHPHKANSLNKIDKLKTFEISYKKYDYKIIADSYTRKFMKKMNYKEYNKILFKNFKIK
jgi:hypothetical protein